MSEPTPAPAVVLGDVIETPVAKCMRNAVLYPLTGTAPDMDRTCDHRLQR